MGVVDRSSCKACSNRDFNNRARFGRISLVVELETVTVVSFRVRRSIVSIFEPVIVALNFVDVVGTFISFLELHGHVRSHHILPDQDQITNLEGFEDAGVVIMCLSLPILCSLDEFLCLGTETSDSVKFGLSIFCW